MAIDQSNGIVNAEENFSDPEGFVDEISDSEVLAEIDVEEPNPAQYEECCVLLFGIPVCGQDRLPKLKNVLGKLFSNVSPDYNDVYPLDDEEKTKGYCFLEFPSRENAENAVLLFDGHVLDKNHTFSAYPLSVFRYSFKPPDENWKAPEKREYVDVGDLWWWTQNPKCLDQFAIQDQNPTNGVMSIGIYWNGRGNGRSAEPQLVENEGLREGWSDSIFKWSPKGSYIATIHKQGAIIWGGEHFQKVQRFHHDNVNFIEFSPNETYLVTYAREERQIGRRENCLRIFDVITGEMKIGFSEQGASKIHEWPFLKWSHNEEFFAFCRPGTNRINVYETTSFTLCDKPIELESVSIFEWSPTKNIIAYHCEERVSSNVPAEIGLMEVSKQARRKIRAQRIFSVSAATLFWQKSGQHFATHTERYNNARKTKEGDIKFLGLASHLDIFDCTGKEVAVQSLHLPGTFVNFQWEPKGGKFCVLVGTGHKVTPMIYQLDNDKPVPQLVSKLEAGIQLNSVEWAPQGGWLSVFGKNTSQGQVYFIDTNGPEAIGIKTVEHPALSQGCWDPTGRYFVTCTFANRDSGYRIHTFQGRELVRKNIEILLRFKWRPRPPVLLNEQKIKEIRKNMKQQSAKFEEEDRRERLEVSKEELKKRRQQKDDFMLIVVANRKTFEAEHTERLELRRGYNTDIVDPSDFVEELITIPLTTEMVPIKEETEE